MTSNEREEIRALIRKELAMLEKSVITITELIDTEVQSDANDWFTTKESDPSREINELSLEKARKRILILNDVLRRIDTSDFGVCVRCGKNIPVGRLKIVPAAVRCVSCQS